MSREIDYQLWDPDKKLMLNCYELLFVQGGIKTSDGCTTQGWIKVNRGFEDKIKPTLILREFTGMYDKSGKKIYDGDIVLFSGYAKYPIFWDNDHMAYGSCLYSDFDYLYRYRSETLEVIGNIYENPELLHEDEEED